MTRRRALSLAMLVAGVTLLAAGMAHSADNGEVRKGGTRL